MVSGTKSGEPLAVRWEPVAVLLEKPRALAASAVLLVDASIVDHIATIARLPHHLVIVAMDEASEKRLGRRLDISLAGLREMAAKNHLLGTAARIASLRHRAIRQRRHLHQSNRELRALNATSIALMAEHDRSALLKKILVEGKRLTSSDGGGLLLAETDDRNVTRLRLELYDFDTLPNLSDLATARLPVDNASIIGHAALTREPLIIPDVYDLPPDAGFELNADFDKRYGYWRRSMLVVPMLDHRDHLVGVLVFVNRKTKAHARITCAEDADRYVIPYSHHEVAIARALASQAAVSIENAELYARIERILEGFVKAAVTAIDQRDPSTAGHSLRVASLATGLAAALERANSGRYRGTSFTRPQMRELRFAALLHDFGKVTVQEDVLMKAKKLPPVLWERVTGRLDLIAKTIEADHYKYRATSDVDFKTARPSIARLNAALDEDLRELTRVRAVIRGANEPTILAGNVSEELDEIARRTFDGPDGRVTPYLAPEELCFLKLPMGTLDEHERREVESHVQETYTFLNTIPWTDDLSNMVTYAYGHHEKLDGTGYPRRLAADAIPVQTRMITIADIFDALTEADRPYKPAVSTEKALDILQSEAKAGRLDSDLVRILIESGAYRTIVERDWRTLLQS